MASRLTLVGVVSLVVTALVAPRARGDDLRQDVFMCEDAVARMRNCCPLTFDENAFHCVYVAAGCNPSDKGTNPDIDVETARCVVDATCQELRDSKCKTVLPCP